MDTHNNSFLHTNIYIYFSPIKGSHNTSFVKVIPGLTSFASDVGNLLKDQYHVLFVYISLGNVVYIVVHSMKDKTESSCTDKTNETKVPFNGFIFLFCEII